MSKIRNIQIDEEEVMTILANMDSTTLAKRLNWNLNNMANLIANHKIRQYDIYCEWFAYNLAYEDKEMNHINDKPVKTDTGHAYDILPYAYTNVQNCLYHLRRSKDLAWLRMIPGILKAHANILITPIIVVKDNA